ncbi:MAG: molecular chaperone HtpG [Stenotrophobium sp.]
MSVEKHEFQAETRQLLRLMIHSLYSNKEIFLRELVSNASDAADKLRFLAIAKPELLGSDPELRIDIGIDQAAGTLTVKDNGVGMSRQEIIENIGTIASSGTRKFLESLSGDQKKDAQLIGQFGVGFYSAFIVADRVTVLSKRADDGDEAVRWESDGEGSYTLEPSFKMDRGTEVILHLREDEKEFLEPMRLRHIISRYSDHIGLPIRMQKDGGSEWEVINQARALWTRPKSGITDEDYRNFYQHLTHDHEMPLAWAHHKVEGNLEYTSLLYIPARAPFNLWEREHVSGVHLYVKRVFIMDQAAELLPPWLRFMKGLVDSSDLPLNVSRELLQGNRTVEKIRFALIKRVLDMLDEMADKNPEDYKKFWRIFGAVLKEGLIEDHANRERIARLCRFHSTAESEGQGVSLPTYLQHMPADQNSIYYITADTLAAAQASPHLEGFRKRGFEVLLLVDRIDEWVVAHLHEFEGRILENVAAAQVELDEKIETADAIKNQQDYQSVLDRVAKTLNARVETVRLSKRLTESPSCLTAGDHAMSRRMEKLFQQAGEKISYSKPVLELNAEHPLVQSLKNISDEETFDDFSELLYGQAVLAEGGQLDDPAAFVKRLNKLVLARSETQPRIVLG